MTPTPPLFLLLLGLVGAHATADQRMAAAMAAGLCKTRPTDLVFIIDSSRSVRPSEFEQVKVFLAKVIEGLDVGLNATRVGVVNYASRVQSEVSLKTHRTKAGLIKAVTKIEPLSTGTMTGLAIQFALNIAFSEAEGARVKSPDINKVAIIVTDGRPQDNVKDVAKRARDAGIEIFAIGVGRVDMSTLRQMASDPLDDHVDYVESYSVIEKLTKKFQVAFCGCSNSATDVVFLIDGSKSVRPENFELVKKFINQIIDKLDVSESQAHVGLVQYSSTVRQEFPLGRYNSKKELKDAVKKMVYMERGTMTGHGIRHITDVTFTPGQGARPGVTKVAVVFTDGRSQDYIGEAAKKAKEMGIRMHAVGVGNAVEEELKVIASEPIAEHYFYTADFKTMTQIAKKLQINVCPDPCECDSLLKFQKKVEGALQALTKKTRDYVEEDRPAGEQNRLRARTPPSSIHLHTNPHTNTHTQKMFTSCKILKRDPCVCVCVNLDPCLYPELSQTSSSSLHLNPSTLGSPGTQSASCHGDHPLCVCVCVCARSEGHPPKPACVFVNKSLPS
ncbi:cartilage matrix protein isoform X1 [Mugil cephalus]|uniref:cartilage matrix protein isoform X1 n=1 Tax=Mugil cephalus TaxID=48193 RepID=UPI001FB85158|nr:cartilage matrix protein isoform X1 [Mugil cephalus]